jgi:hypothetical protein
MEIKISRAGRTCAGCEKAFEHEEKVKSVLSTGEGEGLQRKDYCSACWGAKSNEGNAFSIWATHFIDPRVAEQEPPEVFSPLRRLFYEAVGSEDRCELAKAYLAAQLLRRQRAFRLIKEAEEGEGNVRIALFADRIGDRLIEVRDPNLTYAEMEQGRVALIERLRQLENPEPAEAEGAEEAEHAKLETT